MTRFPVVSSASARLSRVRSSIALLVLSFLLTFSSSPAAGRPASANEATPERRAAVADLALSSERDRHLTLLGVDAWHYAGTRGRGLKVSGLVSWFRGY